jgi:hypothetical protein
VWVRGFAVPARLRPRSDKAVLIREMRADFDADGESPPPHELR